MAKFLIKASYTSDGVKGLHKGWLEILRQNSTTCSQ